MAKPTISFQPTDQQYERYLKLNPRKVNMSDLIRDRFDEILTEAEKVK